MEERISQKPMTYEAGTYHVAVVGAGHAGIEAALACARLGLRTLCFTINLDAVGNVLPANVVSALSVGLYGMFLAVIIPASRKSKVILGVVVVSMAASFALECIPLFASLASGTRIILLTVVIAAGAALLFPVKEEEKEGEGHGA